MKDPGLAIPPMVVPRYCLCPVVISRKYIRRGSEDLLAWAALYLFGLRLACWRIE
jgi:hypothetical protein